MAIGRTMAGLGILVAFLAACTGCDKKKGLTKWDEYRGKIPNYRVLVEETREDGRLRRRAHLDAIKDGTVPHGVTGFDYDNDWEWDEMFIQETDKHGCNGTRLSRDRYGNISGRTWEPCNADKGKVEPFTDRQLSQAEALLDAGVEAVVKPENRVDKLQKYRK